LQAVIEGVSDAQARTKGKHLMRAIVALAVLVMPPSIAGSAFAQEDFTCEDFQHNDDGSWTPLKDMTIAAPNGQIELGPGVSFTVGLPILGLDLAAALNEKCKS
jgi:hypothetical protein